MKFDLLAAAEINLFAFFIGSNFYEVNTRITNAPSPNNIDQSIRLLFHKFTLPSFLLKRQVIVAEINFDYRVCVCFYFLF